MPIEPASFLPHALGRLGSAANHVWLSGDTETVGATLITAVCLPALFSMPTRQKKPGSSQRLGTKKGPNSAGNTHMLFAHRAITIGAAAGLLVAAFLTWAGEAALKLTSWVLLAGHVLATIQADAGPRSHRLLSGIVAGSILAWLHVELAITESQSSVLYLHVAGLVAALFIVGGLFVLPRNTDTFFQGKPVDRERSSSFLGLLTFSWSEIQFDPKTLHSCTLADLPALDEPWRADNLAKTHAKNAKASRYSYKFVVAKTHAWSLITFYILTVVKASAPLAPQAVKYLLLERLQDTVAGTDLYGIGLALGIGLLSICQVWLDAYLPWYSASRLQVPIQSTFMSLVYGKTLRLRGDQTRLGTESKPKKAPTDRIRADSAKSLQVYTSGSRVLRAAAQVITNGAFLMKLIGWRGVAVGIVASWIPIPLTKWLAQNQRKVQFALAEQRDQSSKLLSDALSAIRQLKLTATETIFRGRIAEYRRRELGLMWYDSLWMCAMVFVANISPDILTGIPVYMYAVTNKGMSAPVAFTCIDLFLQLQSELSTLPLQLTYVSEAWTSMKRVDSYFREAEIGERRNVEAVSIALKDASITWLGNEDEKPFTLQHISTEFPDGELSVITGETGSGKSLLLASLAGEAQVISGSVHGPQKTNVDHEEDVSDEDLICRNHFAVVTQTPWIENGTIKANIVFGLPFREARYRDALSCCALNEDTSGMDKGDMTIVGPKGAALSGGQRCRVALARAMYSRAGVLLLDDVLSAVDAEIRSWLVDNALSGKLAKGRTIILATHYASQCEKNAAHLVHLEGGTIKYQKKVDNNDKADTETPAVVATKPAVENGTIIAAENKAVKEDEKNDIPPLTGAPNKEPTAKRTAWYPYVAFFRASGGASTWSAVTLICIIDQAVEFGKSWWLKEWTSQNFADASNIHGLRYYGGMYMVFSTARCLVTVVKCMCFYVVGSKASTALFERMSEGVFGSPLQWLEKTSHGEITMRFNSDTNAVDQRLPHDIGYMLNMAYNTVFILFTGMATSRHVGGIAIALLYIYYTMGRRLIQATRSFQRISAKGTAAMYDHHTAVTAPDGISTIRAYGMKSYFIQRMHQLLDDRSTALRHYMLCTAMMDLRLGVLGVTFVTFVALSAVLTKTSAGEAAIALSFAMRFRKSVVGLLQRAITVERGLDSVGRMAEYGDLETEQTDGLEPGRTWPSEGKVGVVGLSAGYSRDLPPALKKLSFSIAPGERVGIVGRTGAGKTSLTLAFARLIESFAGQIAIDGVDIATINIHALRRRLFIIPQDPHLFAGTVRSVLDPEGQSSDARLADALKLIGLVRPTSAEGSDKTVKADGAFSDLSMEITQGGRNISQGQRQMLYLARALMSASKVVIMDEATNAIDLETDAAIQQAIRDGLRGSTVIVVAHRLATIADFDKVLVLDGGELVECGPPGELLAKKAAFWNFVQHSADRDELMAKMAGEASAAAV